MQGCEFFDGTGVEIGAVVQQGGHHREFAVDQYAPMQWSQCVVAFRFQVKAALQQELDHGGFGVEGRRQVQRRRAAIAPCV